MRHQELSRGQHTRSTPDRAKAGPFENGWARRHDGLEVIGVFVKYSGLEWVSSLRTGPERRGGRRPVDTRKLALSFGAAPGAADENRVLPHIVSLLALETSTST